jgi:DNA-binding response OmpR family regulator
MKPLDLLYLAEVDDPALLRAFAENGWRVRRCDRAGLPWALAAQEYGFVLLDLTVLRTDLLRQCQAACGAAALLVVLADPSAAARARALRAGAQVCLSRPLAFAELHARLLALLRHTGKPPPATRQIRLWLSPSRLLMGCGNRRQPLTVSEQRLLSILAGHPGAVSRDTIERHLWGETREPRNALIERHVCNLRRKLAQLDAPNALQTLRGFGYGLREPVLLRMD